MQVVQFNFSIGQRVKLHAAENIDGVVTGLMRDSQGCQYRVVYWADTTRKIEWMFQHELKAVNAT